MFIPFDSIMSPLELVPEKLEKKKRSLMYKDVFHCIIIIKNNCKPFKCLPIGEKLVNYSITIC